MTIGEKLHRKRESEIAALLEGQGLSLHRQGGLYQVVDSDGIPVTELTTLGEVVKRGELLFGREENV